MKKVLMFVAALIVLASCSDENDVVYSVDPAEDRDISEIGLVDEILEEGLTRREKKLGIA